MDSRFRGNDVIFRRAAGGEESRTGVESIQSEIPRYVRNDGVSEFLSGTQQGRFANRPYKVRDENA